MCIVCDLIRASSDTITKLERAKTIAECWAVYEDACREEKPAANRRDFYAGAVEMHRLLTVAARKRDETAGRALAEECKAFLDEGGMFPAAELAASPAKVKPANGDAAEVRLPESMPPELRAVLAGLMRRPDVAVKVVEIRGGKVTTAAEGAPAPAPEPTRPVE